MKFLLIFSSLILFFNLPTFSQDTVKNVDEAFKRARELGFNGERRKAIDLSQKILKKNPNYADVKIFLGRLYTWESQYDSARIQFKEVLLRDNKNQDAYLALMDCELYDNRPGSAYAYSLEAFKSLENPSEEIYYRKAKALYDSTEYNESLKETEIIIEKFPEFEKAKGLKESNLFMLRKNKISIEYEYDDFNKIFKPWYGANIAYTRKTEKLGSVIGRFNYAKRFDTTGFQGEVDMYPVLIPGTYSYINFGYSSRALFPNYRGGFSIYKSLPKSFEAEIGIRFLRFSSNVNSNNVYIFTGSVGKYYSNFWFSLRPFIIPQDFKKISASFLFITRYYFNGRDNFLGLTTGYGISPDARISPTDVVRLENLVSSDPLKSFRVAMDFSKLFHSKFYFIAGAGIRNEEIRAAVFRINYSLSVGLGMSFR